MTTPPLRFSLLVLNVAWTGCGGRDAPPAPTPAVDAPTAVPAPPGPLNPHQRAALWRAGRAFLEAKPTSDEAMVAALETAAPGSTNEVMFAVLQMLYALEPDPPALEWMHIEGLGAAMGAANRVLDPKDADLVKVGLTRTAFERIRTEMRLGGATRLERFGCMIEDGYHGQRGLVVNEDAAFRRGDTWLVLQGVRNALSFDSPCPPAGIRCEAEEPGWFLCRSVSTP